MSIFVRYTEKSSAGAFVPHVQPGRSVTKTLINRDQLTFYGENVIYLILTRQLTLQRTIHKITNIAINMEK